MRRARVLGWPLVIAAFLSGATAEASAPTRLVYLQSPTATACSGQSQLESAVTERLGYDPFSPWGEQTLVVTVTRNDRGFVARADLVDANGIIRGSREVLATQVGCENLISTLALAISIALDPTFVAQPKETTPIDTATNEETAQRPDLQRAEEEPRTPPRAPSPRVKKPPPPGVRRSGVPLDGLVFAGVAGALEAAPQPTLAGRVGFGLRRRGLSAWAEAWRTLSASDQAEDGSGVTVQLLAGTLAPCLAVVNGFSACGTLSLGSLNVEGQGVSDPHSRSVFYAAAGGRAQLDITLGPKLGLLGNVDLGAVLTRPRFQLRNVDVWRPGPVVASAGIAMVVQIF